MAARWVWGAVPAMAVAVVPGCDGCSESRPDQSQPAASVTGCEPTPPSGLVLPEKRLFSFDTTTNEVSAPIPQSSAVLVSVLGSPDGQRRIELRNSGKTTTVAEKGWNLPPVDVAVVGGFVVCRNVLTGKPREGCVPHPSAGLGLRCTKISAAGDRSAEVDGGASDATASWLSELSLDGETVRVRYVRDSSGWLVAGPGPKDGIYERTSTVNSLAFGESTLIERGSFNP